MSAQDRGEQMHSEVGDRTPQVDMPVVEGARAKISSLNKIAVRMQRHIVDLEQRHCRTQHEQRELAAVEDAIRVMEWHLAAVDDVCESERLLKELVEACRSTEAARTADERSAARAHYEESMQRAGPFVDDMAD